MRLRVYIVTSVLFILIATTLIPALAQDTPTPEPPIVTPTETATLTLTPTEPPTLTLAPTDAPAPTNTDAPTATEAATLEGTPSETPTASATADGTSTETPSLTPSATNTLMPEPGLQFVYSEDFSGRRYPFNDLINGAGTLIRYGANAALILTQPDTAFQITRRTYLDVVVQATFVGSSGSAYLELRATDETSYRVQYQPNGQVVLFRNGEALVTAITTPVIPNQPRTIRFSAIENVLRVNVDGATIIETSDNTPLQEGFVRVGGTEINPTSGLIVDDIAIWRPIETQIASAPAIQMQNSSNSYNFIDPNERFIVSGEIWNGQFLDPSGLISIADGTAALLTFPSYILHAYDPILSADGSRLMFNCSIEGLSPYEICFADADGSNVSILPYALQHSNALRIGEGFSPDGQWALYRVVDFAVGDSVWIVNLETLESHHVYIRIVNTFTVTDAHWGQDNYIYLSFHTYVGAQPNEGIWRVPFEAVLTAPYPPPSTLPPNTEANFQNYHVPALSQITSVYSYFVENNYECEGINHTISSVNSIGALVYMLYDCEQYRLMQSSLFSYGFGGSLPTWSSENDDLFAYFNGIVSSAPLGVDYELTIYDTFTQTFEVVDELPHLDLVTGLTWAVVEESTEQIEATVTAQAQFNATATVLASTPAPMPTLPPLINQAATIPQQRLSENQKSEECGSADPQYPDWVYRVTRAHNDFYFDGARPRVDIDSQRRGVLLESHHPIPQEAMIAWFGNKIFPFNGVPYQTMPTIALPVERHRAISRFFSTATDLAGNRIRGRWSSIPFSDLWNSAELSALTDLQNATSYALRALAEGGASKECAEEWWERFKQYIRSTILSNVCQCVVNLGVNASINSIGRTLRVAGMTEFALDLLEEAGVNPGETLCNRGRMTISRLRGRLGQP
jgi:hypothetical protein